MVDSSLWMSDRAKSMTIVQSVTLTMALNTCERCDMSRNEKMAAMPATICMMKNSSW